MCGGFGVEYATTEELVDFGRRICGVAQPTRVLARIAQAMTKTMAEAKRDSRVPKELWAQMNQAWTTGYAYAR